jgi:hypothetical protein
MQRDVTFVELDADALADWLGRQPGERLWSVDGEDALAGALSFPCPGSKLAPFVRQLGRLRAFVPAAASAAWNEGGGFEALTKDEDGAGVVLALGGTTDAEPQWLLVEDKLAESALASGM